MWLVLWEPSWTARLTNLWGRYPRLHRSSLNSTPHQASLSEELAHSQQSPSSSAVSRLQPQVAQLAQRLQPILTTSRPLPPQPTGIPRPTVLIRVFLELTEDLYSGTYRYTIYKTQAFELTAFRSCLQHTEHFLSAHPGKQHPSRQIRRIQVLQTVAWRRSAYQLRLVASEQITAHSSVFMVLQQLYQIICETTMLQLKLEPTGQKTKL
jgi:hypothetical protein